MRHNKYLLGFAIVATLFAAFVVWSLFDQYPATSRCDWGGGHSCRNVPDVTQVGATTICMFAVATWSFYILWHVVSYFKHGGNPIADSVAHAVVAKRRTSRRIKDRIADLDSK